MRLYHVREIVLAAIQLGAHVVHEDDVTVPRDEVMSPEGRWINCPYCAEALAQEMGGSTKRPTPPSIDEEP